MYERIADKIAKFVLATLKKEKLLEMAAKGQPRPGKRLAKTLCKHAGSSAYDPEFANKGIRKLHPNWFRDDSLETVIQRMLVANKSPAHKANATRALKNYSVKRATEIGSTPKRVAAGVKASVTKRQHKNAR